MQSLDELLTTPELRSQLDTVVDALEAGHLSLADIGGFTDSELDAAFACACHHLTLGQPEQCLAVLATLLLLEPRRQAFHTAAGIALQQLRRLPEAALFYATAVELEPDDAVANMCMGELLVLIGHGAAGTPLLRRGIELADDPKLAAHRSRALRFLNLAETL